MTGVLRPGRHRAALAAQLAALAMFNCLAGVCPAAAATAAGAADAAKPQVELGSPASAVRRLSVAPQRDLIGTGGDRKAARVVAAHGELHRVLRPPAAAGRARSCLRRRVHQQQPWVAIGGTSAPTAGAASHAIHLYDTQSGESLRHIDARAGDAERLRWSSEGSVLIAGYAHSRGVRAFDRGSGPLAVETSGTL